MKRERNQKTARKERGTFLQTILDSVTEGVFTVDRDWNITSFNLAAERITGYPKNWAMGKKCFEVFHADICQTGCVLRKTIETNKSIVDLPINIVNKNGKVIPISISTAVPRGGRGRIIGGVETFRDLSAIEALKNVVKIELLPLSQRREDIPLLIEHFINHFNVRMGKKIQKVSHEVMDLLMRYDFPGNVRELENIIEHAFVLCRGAIIEKDSLPKEFVQKTEKKRVAPAEERLRESEANIIRETLEKYFGHRGRTAKELGIHKSTLWRKMKRYGIH